MEGEAQKFLNRASQSMLEFQVNTLCFEQKIQALMRECKEGLIEKDGSDSGKKNLTGWIKAFHTSNQESGVVITIKARAVEAGIRLSNLVIDFVFMMSRQEELAEKIWKFKSTLKWVTEDGNFNSMVIEKVLTLLEMAEGEVSEIKRSEQLKNKGKEVIVYRDQEERSNVGRIRVNKLLDQFFEQILYQIFDQFLEVVLRLESIISHRNLPAKSQMRMKKALSMLECELKQCEEVLEWIKEDVITMRKMFPLKLGLKLKDSKTTEARNLVASKIDELWGGLLDYSSEEDEENSLMYRIRCERIREMEINASLEIHESDFEPSSSEDDEGDDIQMSSAGVPSPEEEEGPPTSNEGVEVQQSNPETEVEAKKPSKGCCCCCC
jgi:hypothetical protein